MLAFGRAKTKFGNPPPGYVPGLGRGAAGFMTRSDLGPVKSKNEVTLGERDGRAGYVPKHKKLEAAARLEAAALGRFEDPGRADRLAQEDDEADRIFAEVEARISRRKPDSSDRKDGGTSTDPNHGNFNGNSTGADNNGNSDNDPPKVQAMFTDLAHKLADVTHDQWAAIPDTAEPMALRKRKREDQSIRTAIPDSALTLGSNLASQVAAQEGAASSNGQISAAGVVSAALGNGSNDIPSLDDGDDDLTRVGSARGAILGVKLDQAGSGTATSLPKASTDAGGYLTGLNSIATVSAAEVGDIKKARLLLRSVTKTNPQHARGWIAAARLEEHAGKKDAARKVIIEAMEVCPDSPDVWVEAARLLPRKEARTALAQAVSRLPDSVDLWIAAVDIEHDVGKKKRVIRNALDAIPGSARLWKACVELESTEENAKIILGAAVEKAPHAVDLWLALANLESHQKAKEVLNRARHVLPSEPLVWVAAAQLEETRSPESGGAGKPASVMVPKIVKKAVKALHAAGSRWDRSRWLAEAERCERAKCPLTCMAIIDHTSNIGFENVAVGNDDDDDDDDDDDGDDDDDDGDDGDGNGDNGKKSKKKRNGDADDDDDDDDADGVDDVNFQPTVRSRRRAWMRDARACVARGSVITARSLLTACRRQHPSRGSVWLQCVALERDVAEKRAMQRKASARGEIDNDGHDNSNNNNNNNNNKNGNGGIGKEDEDADDKENAKFRAETLAIVTQYKPGGYGDTNSLNDATTALIACLDAATDQCPHSEILWLMCAKEKWVHGNVSAARDTLERAFAVHPTSEEVWLAAAKLETETGEATRARMLLARARSVNGNGGTSAANFGFNQSSSVSEPSASLGCSARVWYKSAILERAEGDADAEKQILDEALAIYEGDPSSEKLWLMRGQLETRLSGPRAGLAVFKRGISKLPLSAPLWVSAASSERDISRRRALLESARVSLPESEDIWIASVRTELGLSPTLEGHSIDAAMSKGASGGGGASSSSDEFAGSALPTASPVAETLIATALRACPRSGRILSLWVEMCPAATRKARAATAASRLPGDPHVITAVARHLWGARRSAKARAWMRRCTTEVDSSNGDAWAVWHRMEMDTARASAAGSENNSNAVAHVERLCEKARPRYGDMWQRVSKGKESWSGGLGVVDILRKVSALVRPMA